MTKKDTEMKTLPIFLKNVGADKSDAVIAQCIELIEKGDAICTSRQGNAINFIACP